jgi:hypothetical protein
MNAAPDQPQALSLYNADALLLVGFVAIILVLVAVAATFSLRAGTRAGAIAGLACVLILMAFLPQWVELLWLWFPDDKPLAALSSAYLWLTFASVISLDRVFMVGTLVSGIVYFAIPGIPRARLLRALACLAAVVLVAIVHSVIQLHRRGLAS